MTDAPLGGVLFHPPAPQWESPSREERPPRFKKNFRGGAGGGEKKPPRPVPRGPTGRGGALGGGVVKYADIRDLEILVLIVAVGHRRDVYD